MDLFYLERWSEPETFQVQDQHSVDRKKMYGHQVMERNRSNMVILLVRQEVRLCDGCDVTHLCRFTNEMQLRDTVAPVLTLVLQLLLLQNSTEQTCLHFYTGLT